MNPQDEAPNESAPAPMANIDFQAAFDCAPIGMLVLREETIVATNRALCTMLSLTPTELVGEHFNALFPEGEGYEAMEPAMRTALTQVGRYREHRLMRRRNAPEGEIPFLCQVNLQYLDLDGAHRLLICTVDDLSQAPQDHADLTARERDVATLLRKRYTAKEIGKCLGISHRTVEVHRAKLMRKYGVKTGAALLRHLQQDAGDWRPFDGDPADPKLDPLAVSSGAYRGSAAHALRYARTTGAGTGSTWA